MPVCRGVTRNLVARQRWDGGWSIKPGYMYGRGERRPDPAPSCWICTLECMRALGRLSGLSPAVIGGVLGFWRSHQNLQVDPVALRLLAEDRVGLLLACVEFCANQWLRVGNPDVDRFVSYLDAARAGDGSIPGLSGYFDVLAAHLIRGVHKDLLGPAGPGVN